MRFDRLTIVFAVVVGSAIAGSQVPFKGNMDGATVPPVTPGFERIEVSGRASHLGNYTAVIEADLTKIQFIGIDPATGFPIATLPFAATFTAANGDKLHADMVLVGVFHPVDQNFPSFTATATITGGTGRFQGASGTFEGSGNQTTVPGEDNDLISGKFAGTISTVGSN